MQSSFDLYPIVLEEHMRAITQKIDDFCKPPSRGPGRGGPSLLFWPLGDDEWFGVVRDPPEGTRQLCGHIANIPPTTEHHLETSCPAEVVV